MTPDDICDPPGPELLAPALCFTYDPAMWISLIGFNATGKSTLAAGLGHALQRQVVDLDRAVESASGRSLPDIFKDGGPTEFRRLELTVLNDLPADRDLILATGGGTLESLASGALLAQRGVVVWLDAVWPVLRRRLAPLPGQEPTAVWRHLGEDGLAALYARRRPLFAALAHLRLDTNSQEPGDLTRHLLGQLAHREVDVLELES